MNKRVQQQNDYIFVIKYATIDSLDNTVHEILQDLENEADLNNCFIEADVRCEKLELGL